MRSHVRIPFLEEGCLLSPLFIMGSQRSPARSPIGQPNRVNLSPTWSPHSSSQACCEYQRIASDAAAAAGDRRRSQAGRDPRCDHLWPAVACGAVDYPIGDRGPPLLDVLCPLSPPPPQQQQQQPQFCEFLSADDSK